MVLALQLYDVYRESTLGLGRKKGLTGEPIALVRTTLMFNVIFCVTGFHPGRQGPFVPAKGPKTIDAPSGLIRGEGRRTEEAGPTRSAQTRPAGG
ncbi:hypothetical protein [Nitrospira sp. Ecomares 2.1]